MKKETLFYCAVAFIISGLTLIGWGIGRLVHFQLEGLIIGFGCGLTSSALPLLKTFRRRDAYEKK